MGARRALAIRVALAVCVPLALAGCISTNIDEVPPSFETLRILRQQDVPPMALGAFTQDKRVIANSVNIRGSTIHPEKGSNFAQFLGLVFATELRAAGKLEPDAPLVLGAELTESRASENLSRGKAALGATVRLTRAGKLVFEKPYRVESEWKSDFIGAIAIPEAFRQFNALYAQMVRQVISDPEFVAAARAGQGQ